MPVQQWDVIQVSQLATAKRKLGIGPSGSWLPAGGAAGLVLTKVSGADYDVAWLPGGGGGPVAGNGIVVVGNTVHFAQAGAYTTGAVPFASGVATMGFDAANLFWDAANLRLGIGTNLPSSPLHVVRAYADALTQSGFTIDVTTSVAGGNKRVFVSTFQTTGVANFNAGLLSGGVIQCLHNGSGNVTGGPRLIGFELYHGKQSAGTGNIDNSIGLFVQSVNLNVVGTITSAFDIYIPTPVTTGAITTNYAIWQNSAQAYSYFNGLLVVGLATFTDYTALRIEKVFSTLLHPRGVHCDIYSNPPADSADFAASGYFLMNSQGIRNFTYALDSLIGVSASALHASTGTCHSANGVTASATRSAGGGAMTNLFGGRFAVANNEAAGSVTNAYGLYVSAATNTGTINDCYALYLGASAGTNLYGLWQNGAADFNFLAGNMSVGTATFSTTITARLQRSFVTNTQACYGLYSETTNTPGAGNAQLNAGGYFLFTSAGVNNFTLADLSVIGVRADVVHSGSGLIGGAAIGVRGFVNKASTGTISNAFAFRGIIDNNNGAGTITNAYVFFATSPVVTGSFGNWYGFYCQASGVVNGYGVYQVGPSDFNYFAGNVAISTATFNDTIAVRLQKTYAATTGCYGFYGDVGNAASGDTANVHWGGFFQFTTSGANNYTLAVDALIGVVGQGIHGGTGTMTAVTGGRFFAHKSNTGAVTAAYAVRAYIYNTNATNAITTATAFWAATPVVTGAITTYYGLYLSAGAGGTVYGAWQDGTTDLNAFRGFTALGSNAPVNTAWALLGASTATVTSLRIPRGSAAYGGTVEGDLWNDFTQKCLIGYISGMKQFDRRVVFAQTADQTVTNTNAETTLFGAGIGSLTFPANFFVVGKTVWICLRGRHTIDASPPNFTIRVKLGGVTLASHVHTDLNDTDQFFEINFLLTCRSTGAGGTVIGQGYMLESETTGASPVAFNALVMTATAALDTTAARTLDVTIQPNVADAGSSHTTTNASVEALC